MLSTHRSVATTGWTRRHNHLNRNWKLNLQQSHRSSARNWTWGMRRSGHRGQMTFHGGPFGSDRITTLSRTRQRPAK